MNIAIDISPLKSEHYLQHRVRGTGFYLENLKRNLLKYYPNNIYTFFIRGQKISKNVDLVHYPYFEPYFLTLPLVSKNRIVVTVHDLTPLVFPTHFPSGLKGEVKWRIQKWALKRANAIITDSKSSKKDIVRYAGIPESKVHVVYLAAGSEFRIHRDSIGTKSRIDKVRKKYGLPDKFVFYAGDVTWNKNLPRLIEAIQKANLPLVMAGKALTTHFDPNNPWNQDMVRVRKLTNVSKNVIRLGFVSTNDLATLYNTATLFTMPSLYEGFGLPILEAMNSGCPVVTTRYGSLPEIAEDSVFYVDPYNVDDISKGLKKVFFDHAAQRKLIEKGLKQAKKFSWEKTVRETIKVYKNAANFTNGFNF